MKDDMTSKTADRRSFLKLAGASVVGGGAAAVATVAGASPADSETLETGGLYKETEHVSTYYKLAKFM